MLIIKAAGAVILVAIALVVIMLTIYTGIRIGYAIYYGITEDDWDLWL